MKGLILIYFLLLLFPCIGLSQLDRSKATADSLFFLAIKQEKLGQTDKAISSYLKAGDYYFTRINLQNLSDTEAIRRFFQCQVLNIRSNIKKARKATTISDINNFPHVLDSVNILNRETILFLLEKVSSIHYNILNFNASLRETKILIDDDLESAKTKCIPLYYHSASLYWTGKFDSAIVMSIKGFNNCQSSDKEEIKNVRARFAENLLNSYSRNADYDSAAFWGNILLQEIFKITPFDSNALANAYCNIGNNYARKRDLDNAKYYLSKSEELYKQLHAFKSLNYAYVLSTLGIINQNLGNYALSTQYFSTSLEIQKNFQNYSAIIHLLRNIAVTNMYLKNYQNSVYYLNKALKIGKENLGAKEQDFVLTLQTKCYIFLNFKKYREATRAYYEALPGTLEVFGKNSVAATNLYEYMGQIKMGLKQFDSAIFYFNKEIEIFKTFNHPTYSLISYVINYKAKSLQCLKEYNQAIVLYQEAILTDMEGSQTITDSLELPIIKNILDKNMLADFLSDKASCLKEMGYKSSNNIEKQKYYDLSLKHFVTSDSLIQNLQKYVLLEKDKIELGEKKYKIDKGIVSCAIENYKMTKNEKYIYIAYRYSSSCKMGVLRDAMKGRNDLLQSDVPDSLRLKEHRLAVDISFLNSKLAELSNYSEGNKIQKELLTKNRQYEELLRIMEQKYPKYYFLAHSNNLVTPEQIQSSLPDTASAVIDYFPTDSVLYIFVISKNRFTARYLNTGSLFEDIKKFLYGIKIIDHPSFEKYGYRLYRKLILPLKPDLAGISKLKIIPSAELCYVPFEALLTSSVPITDTCPDYCKLPYLIRRFDISYHYSSTILYDQFQKENFNKSKNILAMAPVFKDTEYSKLNYDQNSRSVTVKNVIFPELLYSEIEVNNITKILRPIGWNAYSLLGTQATESAFNMLAPKYNILHLSTHSFTNEEQPLLGGIVFHKNKNDAYDGVLYSWEIYNKNLNADLAVLSSCESGKGKLYKGEGMISLTRSFLYAGCRNVIFSLWKVFDNEASQFMTYFYQEVAKNKTYSASLRSAKLRMISSPGDSFPLHWSAFIQVGVN